MANAVCILLLILGLLLNSAAALTLQPNRIARLQQKCSAGAEPAPGIAAESTSVSRRAALHKFAGALAATGTLSTAAVVGGAAPAAADVTRESLKKSYFRYVPRIKASLDWYNGEFKDLVTAEKFDQLLAKYFIKSTTGSENSLRPESYRPVSNKVERELLDPLKLWATTFSEKGTNPKVRQMNEQLKTLQASMDSLEAVARTALVDETAQVGKSKGRGIEIITTQANALASYEAGAAAIKEYLAIANKGLTRELNQVTSPF